MRWLLITAALLNVWPAWGQTFNRRYDLRENGRPNGSWNIESTAGGGYMLIQVSNEADTIAPGVVLTRYMIGLTKIDSQTGEKLWDKRFAPPWRGYAAGWANCCDTLPGGGIVVGGATDDSLQNISAYLSVFDSEGDTVFTRDLGIPGQQWNGFSVKRTQDGGFILVGQTDATGYLDGFAIRTDAQGNELWRRTYGQPTPQTDGLLTLVQLDDGDFIVGGTNYPTNNSKQWWVQRLNAQGDVIWSAFWGPIILGGGPHLERMLDGRVIMASNWSYPGGGSPRRFYMAEIDVADGSLVWERQYGGIAQFQVLFAVKETPNSDLIACGVTQESGFMQGVLLRTTAQGDSLWMRKYWYQDSIYTQGTGQFYDVLPTADGGFIATGPCYRYQPVQPNFPPGYSQDAWVVKVDADGCIVPGCNEVGITEQATNLLGALRIWPNPAQGHANIELTLPPSIAHSHLQLSLVSADWRVVMQQAIPQGLSAFSFPLSDFSPGMYYVHVANGGKWLTRAN